MRLCGDLCEREINMQIIIKIFEDYREWGKRGRDEPAG
jgi:hypothetical protein